ncbi:MAG: radical SAM protein, partial [Deltaproteobacteria bacterium]|nr:radical SAM protein [Deltaproteobacteria bacterium]
MSLENFVSLMGKNKDIPAEAIFKSDLLRLGLSFSPEALKICAQAKPKSYFIFSFDRVSQKELSEMERKAVPEEIALIDGPFHLKRTIVSVRVNPGSPYRVECGDAEDNHKDRPYVTFNGEPIADILLPTRPPYYDVSLPNGKPVTDIAPTIEWGYLIYLTAFRLCQYWGKEEECQFCDINNNYRQQKDSGRSYTGIKSPDEILEALQIIHDKDPEKISHAYTVTGGSVTSKLNGMNESEFYAQYAQAIEKKFPGRWMGKAVVQALPQDEVKLLKDSGYQIYHPNYEVWDKKLFTALCPGKERYVGRDEWMKRIIDAAKIFGPEYVIPNFVAGIEMAQPYGFKTVDEAVASTAEGLDFFMSQGISPRFTVWCVEPNTVLSETNVEPPPLEYFIKLLRVYRETFRKYKLTTPPGYGESGLGKAVF